MGPTLPLETDAWDPDRLRLPPELVGDLAGRRRSPRHRPGEPFIRGPIPHAWVASACRLPGAGLHVAMAYRFHAGRFRFRRGRRWDLADIAGGLRISRDSARRGLQAAERAGLLCVARELGCKLAVSIVEVPGPEDRPDRPPLFGPIPWAWWLPASRLAGKTLQVAAACWLAAGWGRSAEFELALDGWHELGLSRFSASRGLDELEWAGLVAAVRRPGRRPFVIIKAVRHSSGDGGGA